MISQLQMINSYIFDEIVNVDATEQVSCQYIFMGSSR